MSTPGFYIKLHSSLISPLLIAGAPRRFAILNTTLAAAFVLGLHAFYVFPVFIISHLVATWMAKRDPYFFEVLLRSLKKQDYYDV